MALYVDWSRIQPPLTDQEKGSPAFNCGITMLMLDMPAIETDADIREALIRVNFYEALHGPIANMPNGTGSLMATPEYWHRWRGVSVNGTKRTRAQWLKRITDNFLSDTTYNVDRAITRYQEARCSQCGLMDVGGGHPTHSLDCPLLTAH